MHSTNSIDPVSVRGEIESAAESVGRVWPLYSDVGANPLSGFENRPFEQAVADAEALFGGRGYPTASQFRRAWEAGQIDPEILTTLLDDHGITADPESLLDRMERDDQGRSGAPGHDETLNRLMAKWLAAFLDQGQAAWPMPARERGFYESWRRVARYDGEIPVSSTPVGRYYHEQLDDLPEDPFEAIYAALSGESEEDRERIFEHHLAALPGWVGFIKQRMEDNNNPWQEKYPVSLVDYLAVRLILAKHMGVAIAPGDSPHEPSGDGSLRELWLTAWERSYRQTLLDDIQGESDESDEGDDTRPPSAQLVFCIDTRSEILRRHVEKLGEYETYGYAGFFGIPLEYKGHRSTVQTDSCPPMVDPKHHITEQPKEHRRDEAKAFERWDRIKTDGNNLLKSLKNDLAAAFGLVEASGTFFGAALAIRTLAPSSVRDLRERLGSPHPGVFSDPTVDEQDRDDGADGLPVGIPLQRKAFYAETAFDLMGWTEFAPVVVFTGHQSQTVNNPYGSSIDCGACAGSPGTPNARTLAAICNDPEVRSILRDRGIEIPSDTVFLAGEHNTTTDEVTLFVDEGDEALTDRHWEVIRELRRDLDRARAGAADERLRTLGVDSTDSVRETEKRTADWAEPRPEIGLSGNAGFVIGPRRLTEDVNLAGRSFLHSYDWTTDPDGRVLENIVSGPLVVCQMINAQYYFSTVDNTIYGSGSKTTQNAVGNVGVLQGNGGDLMSGLPLQSLYDDDRRAYHQPLRLSTVIHAPVEKVEAVLERNSEITSLFDNRWMALTVIDPERDNEAFHYQGGFEWESMEQPQPSDAPLVATD